MCVRACVRACVRVCVYATIKVDNVSLSCTVTVTVICCGAVNDYRRTGIFAVTNVVTLSLCYGYILQIEFHSHSLLMQFEKDHEKFLSAKISFLWYNSHMVSHVL